MSNVKAVALTRRTGDERLKNMAQVVLKLPELPEQLRLLAGSPPTQGRPSISDLMTKAYETDMLPGKILEVIGMISGLHEITMAECKEEEGQIRYRGSVYVPDSNELCLRNIQEHHDTALAGYPGWATTFDLLDREFYGKEMRHNVDRYVRNCIDCRRTRSSRHLTFGVLWPLSVPIRPWEHISMDFVGGLPECEGFDAIWGVVDQRSKMHHCAPPLQQLMPLGWRNCVWGKWYICMDSRLQLFRIGVQSLHQQSADRYVTDWGSIEECTQHFIQKQTARQNGLMLAWNSTLRLMWIISKMTGYSGYCCPNLLRMMGYQKWQSVLLFSLSKEQIPGYHCLGNLRRNGINHAWTLTRSRPWCHKYITTSE